jgi:hypothetical protein
MDDTAPCTCVCDYGSGRVLLALGSTIALRRSVRHSTLSRRSSLVHRAALLSSGLTVWRIGSSDGEIARPLHGHALAAPDAMIRSRSSTYPM